MKCGIVSLALLGSPASGCWLRSSFDGKRTEVTGRKWAQGGRLEELSLHRQALADTDAAADVARAQRVAGKRALAKACADNAHFSKCSRDKGSANRLERCLVNSGKVSGVCRKGINAWKQLLAETAPDARNRAGKPKKNSHKHRVFPAHLDGLDLDLSMASSTSGPPVPAIGISPHHHHHAPPGDHPPHHGGMGPHHGGMGPHHSMGPQHGTGPHHRGPQDDDRDDDDWVFPQHQERKPTMLSLLADWIFGLGDSSSSDSWLSASTSSSSSSDGGSEGFMTATSTISVDAGFFPAGHGFPLEATEFPFEAIFPVHAAALQPQRRPKKTFKRIVEPAVGAEDQGSEGIVRLIEEWSEPAVVFESESLHGVEIRKDFDMGSASASDQEAENDPWGPGRSKSNIRNNGVPRQSKPPFGKVSKPFGKKKSFGVAARMDDADSPEGHPVLPEPEEEEWELLPAIAVAPPAPPSSRFGGGDVHSMQHHHRGDHIRFRNRLPEDLDSQRAWLTEAWMSESFDVDGDGPDFVEGLLAFFFFVGASTLMLLPFFLLGRALKRLVRSSRGGGDGVEEAPDGYYALPEDDTAAAAAEAGVVSAGDDDSIVVTGTPVNPPPSVHL